MHNMTGIAKHLHISSVLFTDMGCIISTSHSDQSPTSMGQSSSSVIALAISATVVIVLLAVISVIMFYLYFKKKKVKSTDITP